MNYLDNKSRLYFVGIKGIAMTALAILAKEKGFRVTGSDIADIFPSDTELSDAGIAVICGFSPENVDRSAPDLVIYTGAHRGRDNPEVKQAIDKNIPVVSHGQALGLFMENFRQVSVAGCHGKTTTSAMISTIAVASGMDPSYAIGCGRIRGLGLAGHCGKGEWFISEADEYVTDPEHDMTPRFMWQSPSVLVITNIDFDHPDVYRNLSEVKKSYLGFAKKVPDNGVMVISADDRNSAFLHKLSNAVTVGTGKNSRYRVTKIRIAKNRTIFTLSEGETEIIKIRLNVPGKHNAINAAMAAVAANRMGISWSKIRSGLALYGGASRRFEEIGHKNKTVFYDDYAHHPAEIRVTLATAKALFPKRRIIAVFQPHTYSRTKRLLSEFSRAFQDADMVIITDIYASARENSAPGFDGKILVDLKNGIGPNAVYKRSPAEIRLMLSDWLKNNDVVIFMGAGNIYNWSRQITREIISGK